MPGSDRRPTSAPASAQVTILYAGPLLAGACSTKGLDEILPDGAGKVLSLKWFDFNVTPLR